MGRAIRFMLRFFAGFTLAMLLLFIILYWSNSGDYKVMKTTAEDASLPSITFNNYRFHAEVFGDTANPAIIVLHGGPGGDYKSLLPLRDLANNYHVVFYDQRGSGLSPRVRGSELSLDVFVEDLNAFVDSFGHGEKVHLLGHSWGAMLATAYAGKYPEKIDKMVLAEPGFLNPEFANKYMEKVNYFRPEFSFDILGYVARNWFRSLHVDDEDKHAPTDWFMARLMYMPFPQNPIAGYFCEDSLKNGALDFWRVGSMAAATLQQSAMDEQGNFITDFTKGIENFNHQVLFMAGRCNDIIGPEHQEEQMKLFPKAKLVVIEFAGHTMLGEKPKQSIAAIREYLQEEKN